MFDLTPEQTRSAIKPVADQVFFEIQKKYGDQLELTDSFTRDECTCFKFTWNNSKRTFSVAIIHSMNVYIHVRGIDWSKSPSFKCKCRDPNDLCYCDDLEFCTAGELVSHMTPIFPVSEEFQKIQEHKSELERDLLEYLLHPTRVEKWLNSNNKLENYLM